MIRTLSKAIIGTSLLLGALQTAQAATPVITNTAPQSAFIGESFCYDIPLTNSGTTGYGPYLRVIHDADLTFNGATFIGSNSDTVNVGTFDPIANNNELEDPIIAQTVSGTQGYSFSTVDIPVGSVVTNGPDLTTNVCFTIDSNATPAEAFAIEVTPVYEFGDTATGDNGPIVGTTQSASVEAALYQVTTQSSAAENELAAGPSFSATVTHTVDVANGPTIDNLQFTDVLDNGVQYSAQATITGGTGCAIDSEPSTTSTGGTLDVSCASATGTSSENDVRVSYPMHFTNVLNAQQCSTSSIVHPLDFNASFNGNGLTQVSSNDTVSAKHVAIQQRVNAAQSSPGNTLTVTNSIQISDYISVDSLILNDTIADGVDFSSDITVSYGGSTFNITRPASSTDSSQNEAITYNVTNATGTLPGGSVLTVSYTVDIQQNYVGGYTGVDSNAPVVANDSLSFSQSAQYNLVNGAVSCSEGSSDSVSIEGITTTKFLVNSDNNTTTEVLEYAPGESVTYRLHMNIPSGDTNDIVFKDFLPLPVFLVSSSTISTSSDFSTNANFAYGPENTITSLTPTITLSTTENSVTLDWGDISTSTPEVLEVDFTVEVTDEPYADGLRLANLFQGTSTNTPDAVSADLKSAEIIVRAPELTVSLTTSAGNVDAGDTVQYTLTVTNEGGATSFDTTASVPLVAGVASQSLVSATLNGNSTTLGSGSLSAGTYSVENLAAGDVYVLTFTQDIAQTAEPNDVITSEATINWASASGQTVTFDPQKDDASVTVSDIAIASTIVSPTGNVVVGDTVQYRVDVTLPEGTTNDLTVDMTLPAGFEYSNTLTVNSTGFDGTVSASPTVTSSGTVESGQTVKAVFNGSTTTNNDNDPSDNTFSITLEALVQDVTQNAAKTSTQSKQLQVNAGTNNTTNNASATSTNQFSEHVLSATTSVAPSSGVEAGDTVTVTINVENTGTATAYDVDVVSNVNTDIFTNVTEGTTPSGFTYAFENTPDRVTYSGSELAAGDSVQFTYTAEVKAGVQTGSSFNISAQATGDSQTGDQTVERDSQSESADTTATKAISANNITLIASSEAFTNDTGTREAAIGEVLTYSFTTIVPEGQTKETANQDIIEVILPAGMSYQTGTALIRGTFDTGFTTANGVSITGADTTITPVVSGQSVVFDLGDVTNNDNDAGDESITVTLSVLTLNTSNNNRTNNKTVTGEVNYLNESSANQSNNATQNVRIAEPNLTATKAASPSTVDGGSEVTFTVTLTNTAGSRVSRAYDWYINDNVPARFNTVSLVSATHSRGAGIDVSACASISGNELTVESDSCAVSDIDYLEAGESVTVVYTAQVNFDIAFEETVTNTVSTSATSLPGASGTGNATPGAAGSDTGERTGSGANNDSGQNVNDIADSAMASVTANAPTLTLTTTAADAAIGTVVDLTASFSIPTGTTDNFVYTLDLPSGLTYTGDAITITTPVSDFTSTNTPNTTPGEGTDPVVLDFGTITNSASTSQQVTIAVPVEVANILSNQAGTTLTSTGSLSYQDVSTPAPSANVDVDVIEPNLSITQTIIAGATSSDSGDTVTYRTVVTNTGNTATAYAVTFEDVMPAELLGGPDGSGSGVTFSAITLTNPSDEAVLTGTNTALTASDVSETTTTNTSDTLSVAAFDLPALASVTVEYSVIMANEASAGETLTNSVEATYNSQLDGSGRSSADGGDDDNNATLNNYRETASSNVTVDNTLAIQSALNATHSDNDFAVGESVSIDARIDLVEGTIDGVSIVNTLPADIRFDSISINSPAQISYDGAATASVSGNDVTVDFGTVSNTADGNSANDYITVTFTGVVENEVGNGQGTTLTNSVNASGGGESAGPSTLEIDIVEPNLDSTMTLDKTSVSLEDTFTLTIDVGHNSSFADAFETTFNVSVPSGLTYVANSFMGQGTIDDTSSTLLVVDMGSITLVEGSKQVTMQFTVDSDADVGNALSIGLTNGAYSSMSGDTADERDYSFADSINVTGDIAAFIGAAQSVVLSDDVNGNGFIDAGDTVLVTATLTNESDSATATDVVFTHGIPANTNYVAGSATTTKGTLDDSAGIAVNVGDMAFGESETITFELLVDANVANNTLVSLQGSVDSSDTVAEPTDADGNDVNGDQANTFRVGTPASTADLDITQLVSLSTDADTNDVISPNDTLTVTYLLENTGSQALSNIALSDAIPAGLTYVANSAQVSGGHTVSVIGGSLSADFITLAAGASETVSFDVTIDSPLVDFNGNAANESFSLQGEATSDETDTVYADNNRADSDGFQPLTFSASTGAGTPELEIIQYYELVNDVDGDGVVDPGDSVRIYTVATNQGSATAENVSFTQPVNAGLSVVANTAVTSQGVVVSETPFDVNVGGIAPSETVTASVVLTLDANAADNTVFSVQALFSGDNLGANQLSDNDSNASDGENALLIPVTSQAQTVSAPTFALTDTSDGGTSGNNFVQGETLTLTQTVTVPKGTTDDLSLSVTLPANVSLLAEAGELARIFNTGLSSGVNPASINSAASGTAVNVNGNISVSNNTLTLDLGSIVNSDNDGDTETYVFSVELDTSALVPSAATQDLTISSALSYVDGAAQPQSLNANDVTVTLLNRIPSANDDSFTVDEDTTSNTLAVRSNDSDADSGQSIIITSVATPSNGGTVTTDGANLIYTPAADFFGTETVQYTLTDSAGGSDTATATFTVNNVQDAPVAQADSANTTEDTQVVVNVLANDSDVDGDSLSITAANSSNGAVSFAGSNITFTPAQDFNGPALVTYTISDGNGNSDSANLTVDVQADNDAPVATNDSANTNEDNDVIIDVLANDSDVDGDALSVTAVSASAGAASVNSNGDVLYTPPADFNGPVTLNYTVSDGNGGTDSASVSVTVNAVNDAPIANPDSGTVNEDSSVIIDVLTNDTDVDGDALSITNAASPNGSVTFNGNNITFTPTADFNGATTVTYTISDGAGGTGSGTVTINVTNVNDAPVASDDTASTNEDTAVVINVLANDTDIDNDALSVSSVSATNGTAVVNGDGNVVFTPAADYNGSATVAYTVTDGNGGSDNASVSVAIAAVNDNPIANPDTASVNEDESVSINVLANDTDVDGDTLSVASASVSTGSVQVVGNQVNYTPDADFNGSATITYTIEDGAGGSANSTVAVTVVNVNDAPVANNDTASVDEDSSVVVNVIANDTDVDNDTLELTAVNASTGTATINSDGNLLYTPDADYNGAATVTYTVSDGNSGSDSATVSITVNPVNDNPVAVADTASVQEDETVIINALSNDSDIDGDTLQLSAASSSQGTATITGDNTISFTPSADFNGTATITYSVSDGAGGSASSTVTVTVAPVNDAPVANDDAGRVTEDSSTTLAVLDNDTDVDNDELSVTSASASEGTITVNANNSVTYTPPADFDGAATATYTISDGNGGTATASISFTVEGVNDAPIALDDTAVVDEDASVTVAVLANDSDIDEDVLSVSVASSAQGSAVITADSQVTFSPNADFNGEATVSYTVSDGNGATDTATITVTVNPVNDTPITVDDTATVEEDGSVVTDVLANDSDIDEDVLTISDVTVDEGSVAIQGGQVSYTPDENFNGTATITYTVSDGNGATATGTLVVTVTAVNDAPTLADFTAATNQNEALTIDVIANVEDVDTDDTHTIVSATSSDGTVEIVNGKLVYTPSEDYSGEVSIDICIQDAEGEEACARITVTVVYTNIGPVVEDLEFTIYEGDSLPITLTGTDADEDVLTFELVTLPTGEVLGSAPSLLYVTPEDYNGTVLFSYKANDGQEDSNTANITVNVIAVNDAPVAVADLAEATDQNSVTIDVLANDSDIEGDLLSIVGANSDFGSVEIIDNALVFTPGEGTSGEVQVEYTIVDPSGATSTSYVVVNVDRTSDRNDANPRVIAPADIEVDANGYLTLVDLGVATATTSRGQSLPVTLLNGQTRFTPGLHTVYWQATDDEGNTTTVSQTIRVNPQVSLSDDVVVTEGGAASFDVLLSGDAPSYPVTVNYTVSGTADTSDHDLISGTVTIEGGTQATVKFNIIPDSIIDDGETVIVTLNENVNVGEKASQTTTIAEAPVAAVVALSVEQGNTTTLTVGQNEGLVDVLAAISHTNPAADFIYDWSNSSSELANVSGDDGVFTFDPALVAPGVYAVTLLVADSENPTLVSSRTIYIEVVQTLPELTGADTDGDGLPDNIEGAGDADLDGVPNYLDSIALCSLAPEIAGESAQYLVESNAGTCVSAGEYTRGTSNAGVLLLADDSAVTSRIPTDTEANNVGGLFNFDVVNSQSNQAQFDVVIPQRNAVPEDAFMRSWTAELGWFDVIADGDAVIHSAPGAPGFCPVVNSSEWQEGLVAGSWCVKLTLIDGGSYDADATTNGAVSFVGGVGTFVNGNTLPDVQDDQLAIKLNEAVEVDVLANDTDADGDALTLTSVSADFGTATIVNGLVSYTPPEGFVGTVTVTYTVSDGMGGTVTGTLALTVAENNIPVANDDSFTSEEDEAVTLEVLSNDTDEDGDTLSITEVTASTGTVILLPSGELSYQAPANYNGVVTIEYAISDGHGGTDTAQVTLTVTAVNDAPVAVDDTASVTEDGSVTVTVLTNDSDVDGDVLTVTMASTENGSVAVNNGTTVTYTPVANVNGEATFTYTISDGFGGTDTATVTVVIVAINDAPVANNDQANVSEDSSVIINALANDADIDGDTLIITDATANSGTVTISSDGNIVYTPLPNFVGTAIITYTISDGNGGVATAQIMVTVENVNDAPTLEGGEVSTNQDTPLSINVLSNANDIDGDTLTIASAEATNGTVEIINGVGTFTPADGFHGTATITMCVADPSGAQACATYTVTVIDTNDAPTVMDLTFTMEEDATLPIRLQGSDADGDALTYQLATSPDGELVGRLPSVLYAPEADFSGTTSFTYTANDGEETSNVGTVTINVNPVNDAPVARDDEITLGNYNPVAIDVLANDSDADGDTLRIIGARVELGDVSWADDSLTYTPLEGFVGEIVIDYTITDPQSEVARATVIVDVMPDDLADRPVIEVPEDVFVDANALFTKIDLGVASAVDKFGNPLPVSLVDGLIFYEPGNNTAYWQATDEDGLTSVASQAVRVRPLVSITKDQVVLEGHEVEFGIHLNGTSPVYPLEIPYTVSGTADSSDHDLVDGVIVIESGSDITVSFNVFPDADIEGIETVTIELSDVLNIGNKYIHEITIREDNVNPDVDLFTEQDGESRILVVPTGSDVLVSSTVDHPDPTNEYEFVWTSLDADIADTDSVDDTFTFDPSGLEVGVYRIRATVTDADDTAFTDSDTLYIQVVDALPTPAELDSDGDGVPDVVDGLADSDRDGILDYLDPTPECNVLPQEVTFVDGYMVEGDPGVCLRLGNFSVSSELGGAKIIDGDIASDDDIVPDPEATNIGGIFDFIAYGLPEAGQTLNIVMPQLKPIPANAVYRKFTPENGWVTFTENANNRLWSVEGEPGYCPPPGGDYWTEGLTEGHWCVQLEILDGGVDDDDGLVNGTIVDPGGVGVLFNGNSQPVATDDAVTIIVDESVTIEALSNDADPDGDDLRITSATTTFGTAVIAGDTIEYTSPLGFIGEVIVNYGISDGNGGSDLGVITVTIIGNNPPQAVDDTVTIDVDQSVTVNVLANDFDEDGDSIRVVSAQASIGSVSVNPDDTLTFTPPAAFTGNAVVTYIIEDTQGGTSEGRLTITVQPVTVRIENSGGGGGSMNAVLLMLLVFVMTLRRLLAAQRKGVKA
ncbi:tandem-95 repeat protein [Alteromonas sp. HB246098]